jgi:hypothetical protein
MMEYSWNLAEDTGGGGNADSTDRSSVINGQRLIIDARRLQHQTEGLTLLQLLPTFLRVKSYIRQCPP